MLQQETQWSKNQYSNNFFYFPFGTTPLKFFVNVDITLIRNK